MNSIIRKLITIGYPFSIDSQKIRQLYLGKKESSSNIVIFLLTISIIAVFYFSSCTKLIEVDPPIQNIVGQTVYENDASANTVIIGIYALMSEFGSFIHGRYGLAIATGLSGDELTLYSGNTDNSLQYLFQNVTNSSLGNNFWNSIYGFVFRANAAIEGIESSKGISISVKNQLLGEAKFIRAFCYFYLLNLYGDVPLVLTTDPSLSINLPRTDIASVYKQIIHDLVESRKSLNTDYIGGDAKTASMERTRPNKAAATALLARVYLYMKDWNMAEIESSKIISDTKYELLPLTDVFKQNSKETIWALQSRSVFNNNADAIIFNFLPTENGPNENRPVYMSDLLFNAFETGDARKSEWIKIVSDGITSYNHPYKYKTDATNSTVLEYPIILRLSEQYLIRAEARAQLGKIVGSNKAQDDLNNIRFRAGLPTTTASSKDEVINAIYKERQVELFTEGGHRWLDLKRIGRLNELMPSVSSIKGGIWEAFKSLYPIPTYDISSNAGLRGHQNPGYPEQ